MPEEIIHVPDEDVSLLSLADAPENAIRQASEAASAIMGVIASKPKIITFNSEIYFENEDWVFIGKFYGVTVRIAKDNYVEFGSAKGFEAEAEAVLTSTGQVVGRAFMMCLDDEDNWGSRPKYDWVDELDGNGKKIWEEKVIKGVKKNLPKRKRVELQPVKVPLFQLRSMAQTRASSKVLSMIFKFIPVLASKGGKKVSGTPAEEASENFINSTPEHDDRPTRAKRKANPDEIDSQKPHDPDCITSNQASEMWRLARGKGKLSEQEVRERLAELKGKNGKPVTSALDMLKTDYIKFISSLPNVVESDYKQEEPGANG